jgi:uncharacterized protein (DUF362 family)
MVTVETVSSVEGWREALVAISASQGWTAEDGTPFGGLVQRGMRVLVKPNWVMDSNKGPWGLEPLVTDAHAVRALCELLLRCGARSVVVGDAPVQGCDVVRLWDSTGLARWAESVRVGGGALIGPIDFRRTIAKAQDGVVVQTENRRAIDEFTIVDLGENSALEEVTGGRTKFRVTQYNPDLLEERHCPGRHQYLLPNIALEADVIINLPKLKTHKKAGVTGALKNLVGLNGNKEYLPHHRKGSPAEGGDCYPRSNIFKRVQEALYDVQYRSSSRIVRYWSARGASAAGLLSRYHRERIGVEGAWIGNDTIWRTCIDLNVAVRYSDLTGMLRSEPQRRIVHIVDARIAGQGDGPLAPEPYPLNLVLAGEDAAEVDWVGAFLLGFDPELIPLIREAHKRLAPKDSDGKHSLKLVRSDGQPAQLDAAVHARSVPEGWLSAVREELRGAVNGVSFR